MPAIVSPSRVLHEVPDQAALDTLVERLGVERKLAGNLAQLCGFKQAPRGKRGEAEGWKKLDDVIWLQRDGDSRCVPVVGFHRKFDWS